MRSLGGLLFFLGVGSLVLMLFDMEFMLLAPLSPYQPWAGIVVAVIGAVLIALGERQERQAAVGDSDVPPTAAPPPATPAAASMPHATVDRPAPADADLSSPVPLGPSSEAGATSGTGTSAPAPVVAAGPDASPPVPPGVPTENQPASDVPSSSSHRDA